MGPLACFCAALLASVGSHLGENLRSLPLVPLRESPASSPKECVQANVQWPNTLMIFSAIVSVRQIFHVVFTMFNKLVDTYPALLVVLLWYLSLGLKRETPDRMSGLRVAITVS